MTSTKVRAAGSSVVAKRTDEQGPGDPWIPSHMTKCGASADIDARLVQACEFRCERVRRSRLENWMASQISRNSSGARRRPLRLRRHCSPRGPRSKRTAVWRRAAAIRHRMRGGPNRPSELFARLSDRAASLRRSARISGRPRAPLDHLSGDFRHPHPIRQFLSRFARFRRPWQTKINALLTRSLEFEGSDIHQSVRQRTD